MRDARVNAFLVGEAFMRAADPGWRRWRACSDEQPPCPRAMTAHAQPCPEARTGFVFICPGRHEANRGYPCAAVPAPTSTACLEVLHQRRPDLFPSASRGWQHVVTNLGIVWSIRR